MSQHQPIPQRLDEAMHELEQIVAQIETGQVPFEQAVARYERGRHLLEHCRGILDDAEKVIAQLPPGGEAPPAS